MNATLSGLLQRVIPVVIAFGLGATAGTVNSYVNVRADAATLTARVMGTEQRLTSLEQGLAEWRASDERTAQALSSQIKDAVDILTDLRIRLGPVKR